LGLHCRDCEPQEDVEGRGDVARSEQFCVVAQNLLSHLQGLGFSGSGLRDVEGGTDAARSEQFCVVAQNLLSHLGVQG